MMLAGKIVEMKIHSKKRQVVTKKVPKSNVFF